MDLDELVSRINTFSELDGAEKQTFINQLVGIHPTLNAHWGHGRDFRRVRVLEDEKWPEKVEDVIWPKTYAAGAGRVSPEAIPTFFLAGDRDAALCEKHIDRSWVVIADFAIRPQHAIFVAPIGELSRIVRAGRGYLSGEASAEISTMVNACSPRDGRSLVITDAFLYDLVAEQNNYQISSYVAGAIFRKLNKVSAVAYSSKQQPGAINVAVKRNDFWENWGVRCVRRAFAEHLALGFYRLSRVTSVIGIYKSGKFQWEEGETDEESRCLLEPLYFPANPKV